MGSMAVTGIGTGSVTHHVAIMSAIPPTAQASGVNPTGAANTHGIKAKAGPRITPMRCRPVKVEVAGVERGVCMDLRL